MPTRCGQQPFDQPEVREAIALALDREAIAEYVRSLPAIRNEVRAPPKE